MVDNTLTILNRAMKEAKEQKNIIENKICKIQNDINMIQKGFQNKTKKEGVYV